MSTEDLPTGGLRLVSDEGRTITHPSMRGRTPHNGAAAVDSAALDDEGSDAGTVDLVTIDAPDALDAELSARDQQAELFAAIEAVLMVAEEPVSAEVLATVTIEPVPAVEQACAQIAREYAATGRGFSIVRVAGGYQLQSAVAAADYVERFLGGRRSARLSAAAMETLALVAYKQPISRAQISAIRGVNADGVVRTLSDQGYLTEVGRDPGPGTASLLGTTDLLLQRLGLDSLDDLPSLSELSVDPDAVEAMDRIAAERTG
ncbi:SMC-Scp complex subunit ScpB [Candidatus Poriferisodalis sp.]|uniref:SMC-Scp complex subunit ScpB n=1 Tax=Candidatus Poriferisodalis sp. TaxID=3101277 RepID=UPI003B0133EE